jgi:ABC-type hemin transport system ATPase subunit
VRIDAIELEWFRGAADSVSLDAGDKSVVVYGLNGAGKSSFVDAVEYVLNAGRIEHLAHEYSGKRQERAVRNTHAPEDSDARFRITVADSTHVAVVIHKNGLSETSGGAAAVMTRWEYRRTILRQEEVVHFINARKGEKYSTLLPLLGLEGLEVAAENLRQLGKAVATEGQLEGLQRELKQREAERHKTFGGASDAEVVAWIERLHTKYCSGATAPEDSPSLCGNVLAAIEARVASSSADVRRHAALQEAGKVDLEPDIQAIRAHTSKLAGAAEPLIAERLEVLQASTRFGAKLEGSDEIDCPACGRLIPVEDFRAHVEVEEKRLSELIAASDSRRTSVASLCQSLSTLKASLTKPDMTSWRDSLGEGPLAQSLAYLEDFAPEDLRDSCDEGDLRDIEKRVMPLIGAARSDSEEAPPEAKELAEDKTVVVAAQDSLQAKALSCRTKRLEALVTFINRLEQRIRDQIRLRSDKVIKELSADIQALWAVLHPGEPIDDVGLYVPAGADKAIDIGLTFHGRRQESPRLTLSEGYRNSLGLCIFLAMAKRDAGEDRPIILDDVVISLDRNHRGMVQELLRQEFSDRQVIILTHDRDWFAELRQQLDPADWRFRQLLPYESPTVGIRWSDRAGGLGAARAQLAARPDAAANAARKIMDLEMATIAERLQLRLPYLKSVRNDRRTAHDFLQRLAADGKSCLQRRVSGKWEVHEEALTSIEEADRLLVSWGNRGSHSFDVVHAEAERLIDVCERALDFLKCPRCNAGIVVLDPARECVQCRCGDMRWRYGKA